MIESVSGYSAECKMRILRDESVHTLLSDLPSVFSPLCYRAASAEEKKAGTRSSRDIKPAVSDHRVATDQHKRITSQVNM